MPNKLFKFISKHKLVAGIIILLVLVGGYFEYRSIKNGAGKDRYVSATVEKGTIVSSVSGSGQVSASNQVDIKAKISGDVISVGVESGQTVRAGALLAQLDSQEAQKTVRDAEASLESAKISLEKLQQPADQLSVLQAENALAQAKESKQKAEDDLKKTYEDGFNSVANAFLELPTVMAGLQDTLFGYSFVGGQYNIDYYVDATKNYDEKVLQYKDDAYNKYQIARKAYDNNFQDYKSASRFSEISVIESLVNETYDTTKDIAEAAKSANNLIQFYEDKLTEHRIKSPALADAQLANLSSYIGKTSTHLSDLLSTQQSIQSDKDAITSATRSIEEKTATLAKLKAGADSLDIQSQTLAIKQRENALSDAREKLADYFIRAPFDGVVAKINVKKGDSASASGAIATLITKQRIAEVSLNEVDVAKIKVGQKTTLTFDAIPNLNITGEVAEIDAVGTITQGVVTYNVKISFDTQDDRVKPGMSVSAAIITNIKQDVIVVSNSAIKSKNNAKYVELLVSGLPVSQPVEVGISNDTMTEITNGVKEGDAIITQTITAGAKSTTAGSTSQGGAGLRIPGMTGGGGSFRGGVRGD